MMLLGEPTEGTGFLFPIPIKDSHVDFLVLSSKYIYFCILLPKSFLSILSNIHSLILLNHPSNFLVKFMPISKCSSQTSSSLSHSWVFLPQLQQPKSRSSPPWYWTNESQTTCVSDTSLLATSNSSPFGWLDGVTTMRRRFLLLCQPIFIILLQSPTNNNSSKSGCGRGLLDNLRGQCGGSSSINSWQCYAVTENPHDTRVTFSLNTWAIASSPWCVTDAIWLASLGSNRATGVTCRDV